MIGYRILCGVAGLALVCGGMGAANAVAAPSADIKAYDSICRNESNPEDAFHCLSGAYLAQTANLGHVISGIEGGYGKTSQVVVFLHRSQTLWRQDMTAACEGMTGYANGFGDKTDTGRLYVSEPMRCKVLMTRDRALMLKDLFN